MRNGKRIGGKVVTGISLLAIALSVLGVIRLERVNGAPVAAPAAGASGLPTVYVIGDSLVKTKATGRKGWGDELVEFFDPKKVNVENAGHAGESSRTFYLIDLWPEVKAKLKKGDFVLIEFSVIENKTSMNFTRYTLPGIGAEEEEGVDQRTGEKFRIHTYGWYLSKFIEETRAAGATPILVTPPGRVRWEGNKVVFEDNGFFKWTMEEAKAAGVGMIDLNAQAAGKYEAAGPEKSREFQSNGGTTTTPAGAKFNAACVTLGILGLKEGAASSLAGYLKTTAKEDAEKAAAGAAGLP